jgi:hypothetical protein
LGGKAEGDLSVAFADVARGLDETTMGAIRETISDAISGRVTADELTDALWTKIKEMIGEGGGGDRDIRLGSGETNRNGTDSKIKFSSPFPNQCTNLQITNERPSGTATSGAEIYQHTEISDIDRYGFTVSGQAHAGDEYGARSLIFNYIAIGN